MAEGNSVFDEIKAQNRKMKGKPFKEKFQYFWEYYKVPTLVTLLVIIFASNLIYTIATAKDSAFSGLWINGYTDMDTEAYMEGFDEYAQVDTSEYATSLEVNFSIQEEATDQYAMANVQKLAALVAAKELDAITADKDTFLGYAEAGYFYDLSELLSSEQLEKYADRLIYYDVPEDDLGEIPIGIRVSDFPIFQSTMTYAGYEDAYFGIMVNSERTDNAIKFLEYMESGLNLPETAAAE